MNGIGQEGTVKSQPAAMDNAAYFLTVVQAVPGEGRTVYAYFDNGASRLFDTAPLIKGGMLFELI